MTASQTVEWDELTEAEQKKVLARREKAAKGGGKKGKGKSRGVHVVWVVDRSGSMASVHSDVVGGFNKFIEDQHRNPAPCRVTLHQFDANGVANAFVNPVLETIYDAVPLSQVRTMTLSDFTPRGMTPLYDALGNAVARTQAQVDASGEDVVVVVYTDGYENASHEYNAEQIRGLVKAKEEAGWTFLFLGAGIDAYAVGSHIGMSALNTQGTANDGWGVAATFDNVSSAVYGHRTRAFAGGQSMNTNYYAGVGKTAEEDAKRRGKATPSAK